MPLLVRLLGRLGGVMLNEACNAKVMHAESFSFPIERGGHMLYSSDLPRRHPVPNSSVVRHNQNTDRTVITTITHLGIESWFDS
jgi:hypothetical protein